MREPLFFQFHDIRRFEILPRNLLTQRAKMVVIRKYLQFAEGAFAAAIILRMGFAIADSYENLAGQSFFLRTD